MNILPLDAFIYSLLFHVALGSKSCYFQYKLLSRCLPTNAFVYKIGIISSPACSFGGEMSECLEHFLISCHHPKCLGSEVIEWLHIHEVKTGHLSEKDIMFGIPKCEGRQAICKSHFVS